MAALKPFKVKPFIVWTFIIILVMLVMFGSTRSNYQSRGSMSEVVFSEPSVNTHSPPSVSLTPSPTTVVPSQIPDDTYTPLTYVPPNLFPAPVADGMTDYDHVNLPVFTIGVRSGVNMIALGEAEEDAMYPATLDEIFEASEQQGFMQASVDTLYDVMKLTPPKLMTDQL
jgi:hypothetical protein